MVLHNGRNKQAAALVFILATCVFFWSIDSCFTVWDSQLRFMTPGKNWAYITVFFIDNGDDQTEYFTNTIYINKICLNLIQLVFCFQWCFQILKYVNYHCASVDLEVTGRKRWTNNMYIQDLQKQHSEMYTWKLIINCMFRVILNEILGCGARKCFESEVSDNKFHRTPHQQYLTRCFSIPIEHVQLWTRNATFVTGTILEAAEKETGCSLTYLKFWIRSEEYKVEVIKALDLCQMMFCNMSHFRNQ